MDVGGCRVQTAVAMNQDGLQVYKCFFFLLFFIDKVPFRSIQPFCLVLMT